MIRIRLAFLLLIAVALRPRQPSTFAQRLALGNAINRTQPTTKGD